MQKDEQISWRTEFVFLMNRVMGTPCWCLLSMLVFILYKNLHLSPLQITMIVALKPTSSLLAPYWSHKISKRPDKIIANLASANFLRHLPFLFLPWIESSWFIIFSFGFYMMLMRATIPAWMELFKYNLVKERQEKMVGYGTTIDYLGTAILAVGMGILLDSNPDSWKWMFSGAAALGLVSSLLLLFISVNHKSEMIVEEKFGVTEKIVKPWREVWQLILQRKDFTVFQIGFMFGGAGLMIMQPALPQFFIDVLHLSFTEMGFAIALCKGVGVALTVPLWIRFFRRSNIFQLCTVVTLFAALFPFFLLATPLHISLLYFAYIFYGVMQAGSELSWHMSGLVFAKEKDSSIFSITNVLTVGIRGCIIPAIGSFFLPFLHPLGVIALGAFICLFGSGFFFLNSRKNFSPEKI